MTIISFIFYQTKNVKIIIQTFGICRVTTTQYFYHTHSIQQISISVQSQKKFNK